ncbi:MAG: hypothetical protein OXR64_09270 [Chloroflexota bacterium]|nr:hypothetical protein [Chloroflexota bacterium]MDE2920023.1 hypothetical protein [Chloroflexota bacterium]
MARTLSRDALLQQVADARAPGTWQPDTAPRTRAVSGIGLWTTVLTTGLLVGRRYIDPGSGSFAIQIIIAAVLGGLLTARLWLRHMFWRIFGRRRRSESDDQPSVEEADR